MRAGCGGGGRSPPSQEARKREDARAGPGSSPQRTGEAAGLPSAPPPPPSPPLSPGHPPHPCAAGTRGPPVPAPLGRGPPPARRPPAPSPDAAAAASRPGAAPRARRLCQSPPSSPSEPENQPGCEAPPPGPVGTWQSKGGGHGGYAGQRVERGRAQESQSGCGGSRLLPAAAMAVPSPQPRPNMAVPPPLPPLCRRPGARPGQGTPHQGEKKETFVY